MKRMELVDRRSGDGLGSGVWNEWEVGVIHLKMSELRQPTSGRAKFLILLTAAAMSAVPAMAAAAPPPAVPPAAASPAPRTAAPPQRPANPDYAPDQPDTSEAAPVPAPLPPALWDAAGAAALLQ